MSTNDHGWRTHLDDQITLLDLVTEVGRGAWNAIMHYTFGVTFTQKKSDLYAFAIRMESLTAHMVADSNPEITKSTYMGSICNKIKGGMILGCERARQKHAFTVDFGPLSCSRILKRTA